MERPAANQGMKYSTDDFIFPGCYCGNHLLMAAGPHRVTHSPIHHHGRPRHFQRMYWHLRWADFLPNPHAAKLVHHPSLLLGYLPIHRFGMLGYLPIHRFGLLGYPPILILTKHYYHPNRAALSRPSSPCLHRGQQALPDQSHRLVAHHSLCHGSQASFPAPSCAQLPPRCASRLLSAVNSSE